MIKAIIIEDEMNSIKALQNDLKMLCPQVSIVKVCQSAAEGLQAIQELQPNLIFLDIKMPGMNGFDMLSKLESISCQIIFTTAHDEFAARAFRVSAVDYLLKPIDGEELVAAVEKAADLIARDTSNSKTVVNMLHNATLPDEQHKIAIPNRQGYDFITIDDILYCKAEGAYTNIVLKNKKLLLSRSLGETEQLLPMQLFERAHHSILVNIRHITSYSKADGSHIVMANGDQLSVSRARRDQLLKRLGIR